MEERHGGTGLVSKTLGERNMFFHLSPSLGDQGSPLCTHSQCVYFPCALTLLSVYLPCILTLDMYTPLVHSLSVCIPHCALALGICTSLLSLRPAAQCSNTDVGEDRHSTLSVPFSTGREDRMSCLHLVSQREVPQGCLCNNLWEGIGGTVAHPSGVYPASTL